jgi:hypothetical protein
VTARFLIYGERATFHPEQSWLTSSGCGDLERSASSGRLFETQHLTVLGMRQFTRSYIGPRLRRRRSAQNSRDARPQCSPRVGLCVGNPRGEAVSPRRDKRTAPSQPHLINEYCHYRQAHNGASERTLVRDRDIENARFLEQPRRGRSPLGTRA